jgi:putative ABC transport system permease protein
MKTRRKLLKPRWRKVLADLWEGKMRTLLVVASIAVGAFAIGSIATTYVILGDDLTLSYTSIHPANIEMVTTPFEEAFLRSVERVPGVAQAEGRQSLSVRASKDGVSWLSLSLLAAKDAGATQINQLKPVAGVTVPGKHELLIVYNKVRDTGFRTGDWLQVELPDGTLRSMRVAGEVGDLTTAHDPMGRQRGFIKEDTLTWLGGSWQYDRLLVTVSAHGDDETYIQSVAEAIETRVEKNGGAVYRYSVFKSDDFPMADMAMAVFDILGVLGVLVVLLSSSLIVNTLNALFAQQLRQIGVMKLVGARRGQVQRMYLLLILAYALLALLITVPLGAWAGYGLSVTMAGMFNATLKGFRIIPAAVAIQVVVAICVPLAAGILPVRSGSKISVRRAISNDSMSDQAPRGGSPGGLNRLGVGLLSRPVLLSIRNTFRRKGRLLLTLFTLTMAGAVFIAVFNVRASMEVYMDQLLQHFMADVTLSLDHPYRVERIVQAARQVAGVEQVEAWSGAAAEILDPQDNLLENLNIVAPPADTRLLKPEMLAGRWIRPGDQRALAVSSAIYTVYPNLQPGDTLRLRVAGGRIEDWTVVGVFSFTNMLGDLLSYADYDYISGLLGTPGQSSSYRLITNTHSLEIQQALCEAIDRHMRSLNLQVQNVEAGMVIRKQSAQAINILIAFLLSMALLTAFVGSIGLTGTMGMNVLERTREIGVMRAIGAVDLAIVKSVVIEGVLIGLISWACAWALSYPISFVMLRIISTAMQSDPIALTYTLKGVFLWLVVVALLSAVASVLPARNAARLTIREVLAYE